MDKTAIDTFTDLSAKNKKSNYQWFIVGAASIYCIIWSGLGYYIFSVFVKSLQAEFNWDHSAIMVGFLTLSLTNGASSVLVGRAVDRFHAKRVMMVGSAIATAGFLSLAFIQALPHFYLGFIVVGVGIASIGQVPCTALVSEWFEKKRGLAIGFMSVGVGVGGLIMPTIGSGLLIPMLGWRGAYMAIAGILFATTFPLALFVIRPKYPKMSDIQIQDKEASLENLQQGKKRRDKNPYLTSPLLWLIAFGFLFSQFGMTGTLQNQVPHMTDVGFLPIVAASVLGMIGLISSFAKFFFGWLCDIIQVRFVFIISVILQAVSTSILINITPDSPAAIIWFYAFAMGIGGGSWLPIMSMYVSRNFPMKYYGSLIGIVNFIFSIGVATGPLFAGYLFDLKGSYRLAFTIFLGCYAVAVTMGFLSKSKSLSAVPS